MTDREWIEDAGGRWIPEKPLRAELVKRATVGTVVRVESDGTIRPVRERES